MAQGSTDRSIDRSTYRSPRKQVLRLLREVDAQRGDFVGKHAVVLRLIQYDHGHCMGRSTTRRTYHTRPRQGWLVLNLGSPLLLPLTVLPKNVLVRIVATAHPTRPQIQLFSLVLSQLCTVLYTCCAGLFLVFFSFPSFCFP